MESCSSDNSVNTIGESPRPRPPRRSRWRFVWRTLFVISVAANILMFLALAGFAALVATGQGRLFTEEVLEPGPRTAKIAVIPVNGLIDADMARMVQVQLRAAARNDAVKGVILRVSSPGGTVSASDQLYDQLAGFGEQSEKPLVALMEAVAASGGYYTCLGCDFIMAEPTAITGSIGVIMGHFVLQELLEDKLGIEPVVIKSGPKKDWPSPFRPFTDEERTYLEEKLINPAYERFVGIFSERRGLADPEARRLGDGSIYPADEALAEGLVDSIGYLADAVETVKQLAGIEDAQVVEYRKPFSISELVGVRSTLKLDRSTLYELAGPELMYLWTGK